MSMTLFHGTKHPYRAGDALVPGGVVQGCAIAEDGEPTPACECGCDGRIVVWATSDLTDAVHAAVNRACTCGDASADHRPRVFEVEVEGTAPDPNAYSENSVMATSGRVVQEVIIPTA